VRYSFTLFELTPDGSRVRVQTDSTDQPFDINEGSKLELGSTAKMRVLTTYLQIIAELHDKYAGMSIPELKKVDVPEQDRLSRWVVDYLIQNKDRSLQPMLGAALDRKYSASPGEAFFTGGGLHVFHNFRKEDNGRMPTLRDALRESINLPFIRLMRDLVRYTTYSGPNNSSELLKDDRDPRRQEYLARSPTAKALHSCSSSGKVQEQGHPGSPRHLPRQHAPHPDPHGRRAPVPVAARQPGKLQHLRALAPHRRQAHRKTHGRTPDKALRQLRPGQLRPAGPRLHRQGPPAGPVDDGLPAEPPGRHLQGYRQGQPVRTPGGLQLAVQEQAQGRP
jgi:hypothetical protein